MLIGGGPIDGYGLPVKFIESIFSTKPHESLGILVDVVNRAEREPFINGDSLETYIFILSEKWRIQQQYYYEKIKISFDHPGKRGSIGISMTHKYRSKLPNRNV